MAHGPREQIVTALLSLLSSAITVNFTASTTLGSPELSNPSSTDGLFVGMPIDNALFPVSTFIFDLGPPLMLSEAATGSESNVVFSTGFRTIGRRLILWERVHEQPALFVRNIGDDYPPRPVSELPTAPTMECEAWIYSNSGKNSSLPSSVVLNNLIDAIKAVMDPVPGFPQNLGLDGTTLVHAWIEGYVDMHPGDLDGQAIAVVPIKILAPGL